jgi:hypothetical protein
VSVKRAVAKGLAQAAADAAARAGHDDCEITLCITAQAREALRELRETGLFGNGKDVESVAEELLRKAVREAREWLCNT